MWRIGWRIVLCLVLGVMTSVAVAVAIGFWRNRPYSDFLPGEAIDYTSGWTWMVTVEGGFGWTVVESVRWSMGEDVEAYTADTEEDLLAGVFIVSPSELNARIPYGLPSKTADPVFIVELSRAGKTMEAPYPSDDPRAPGSYEYAPSATEYSECLVTGWPFRCMWRETDYFVRPIISPPPLLPEQSMSFVSGPERVRPEDLVALVLYPSWPGLLANTVIYGSAWWLLLLGPGTFIRWRRRRAGRCIKCGYDLRGTASEKCSECGTKR